MTKIVVTADYAVGADKLWQLAVRYDVLERMMSGPFVRVTCPPGEERTGDDVSLTFKLFGLIPVGTWHFKVVERNDAARCLRSEESGTLVRRWVHEIAIEALGASAARHTDTIDIDAGGFTPLIAHFARADYARRHRLRRQILTEGR